MVMDNGSAQKAHNDLVMSFLAVRRAIGGLGYFLPLALTAFAILSGQGLQTSISAAYYSPMREVFVGTLIAQAVFLWSYEGFRPDAGEIITDRRTARVAAVAVALVALAPTSGPVQSCTLLQCVLGAPFAAMVHLVAAAVFFLALAVFCLVLFVKGDSDSAEKQASNRIYRLCGWLILGSIGMIGLLFVTGLEDALSWLRPVFILEAVATFAFATSWAVKGDALRPLVRGMS